MTKPVFDMASYKNAGPFEQNSTVLHWLSDDDRRSALYEAINNAGGVLAVPSRCQTAAPPSTGQPPMFLVTKLDEIQRVLENQDHEFSSRTYAPLGGGNFMLALDPWQKPTQSDMYDAQKGALMAAFPREPHITQLCAHGIAFAEVMSLAAPVFDLAEFAKEAALRFCTAMYGYPLADHITLRNTLQATFNALTYQTLGRHFATELGTIPACDTALGLLTDTTAALIDDYWRHAPGKPHKVAPLPDVPGFVPVFQKLVANPCGLSGTELAMIVAGAMAGTVGSIQASVCIAVRHLFKNVTLARARAFDDIQLRAAIETALRENPPIGFIPRYCPKGDTLTNGQPGREIVLALGGANFAGRGSAMDQVVFGMDGTNGAPHGMHACIGNFLAKPMIRQLVRRVIDLPGLTEGLDPLTGKVVGIRKTWGFRCESYPLAYRMSTVRAQQTLNIAMRVKPPISDNAMKLRAVIAAGAPRIDEALQNARHVHFAWFEFSIDDTLLVLHTVYDGDFNAYIQHFALSVSDMFDALFVYIEGAPPTPVRKFPQEFIALVAAYNQPPAMNYFFSAYPTAETAQIQRWQSKFKCKGKCECKPKCDCACHCDCDCGCTCKGTP